MFRDTCRTARESTSQTYRTLALCCLTNDSAKPPPRLFTPITAARIVSLGGLEANARIVAGAKPRLALPSAVALRNFRLFIGSFMLRAEYRLYFGKWEGQNYIRQNITTVPAVEDFFAGMRNKAATYLFAVPYVYDAGAFRAFFVRRLSMLALAPSPWSRN